MYLYGETHPQQYRDEAPPVVGRGSENKLSQTISHGQEVTFSLAGEFPNKDDYLGGINIVPGTKCFTYIITVNPAATKSRADFLYPFYSE